MRRFLVPVFVTALTLGIAPRPSFGADDHFRCMYRCAERGLDPPRRSGLRQWAWPHPRPPARPRSDRRCWIFCGSERGRGWGDGGWGGGRSGGSWWDHDRYDHHDRWDRWDWHGRWGRWNRYDPWDRYDRYDGYDRHRDRDGSGYDAHRSHPRGRDF